MRTISRSLAITVGALLSLLAAGGPAQAAFVNFDHQANLVQPVPFPQNK